MSEKLQVVTLLGSLRKGSFNGMVARTLPKIAPASMEVNALPSIADIPLYDADVQQEEGFPATVEALAGMVPGYAAAGALIYVGVLMTSSLARVNWQDLTESVPAFITAVMMPFSFSITEGIALGFISYCVMKIGTGRLRDLSPCVIIVALLFILKIVFIDAH